MRPEPSQRREQDLLRSCYPETEFGGYTNIDGSICFYLCVNALLRPTDTVLDIGCGRGQAADDPVPIRQKLRILRGQCTQVIGIDVDASAATNPFVDDFRLIDKHAGRWPIDDASCDLCLADWLLEHLADPELFFRECRRVLRPGGHLCIRTPNTRGYVALISRLVPRRHHASVLEKVSDQRKAKDIFPAHYRCNTIASIRRAFRQHGFRGYVFGYEAEPVYLSFSRLLYRLGTLHQRLAPQSFKLAIFAFGRKTP
jgi:SAM-dependent methyltransferase